MLHFLNPGGLRQRWGLFWGLTVTASYAVPYNLYHVEGRREGGGGKAEMKKEEERTGRSEQIRQWESCLCSLTAAFHVDRCHLPGLNTGLQTHWEHYCYGKIKASTSPRKLGLYYAFPFIIYPPFFSNTLLNSAKTPSLHEVAVFCLALFQVDAVRRMVMISVFEGLQNGSRHTAQYSR